jgi:curved DNA-binding protein CbpA
MAVPRTHYDILNVSPHAEPVVVEAAYRALIKKYHPDQAADVPVSKDAAAINEAFAILKDSGRRAEYDHRLWTRQQSARLSELKALDRPRPARLFGWSGWLAALLLAVALASVVAGRPVVLPVPAGLGAAAATAGAEEAVRAVAARTAAAEEARVGSHMPSSAAILARVRAEQGFYPRPPPRAERPAGGPAARPVPVRKPKARARPRREEADFLEREGYIY